MKGEKMPRLIDRIRLRIFCKRNRYYCPDCIYHEFVFEGAVFRGNNCRWWKERDGNGSMEQEGK